MIVDKKGRMFEDRRKATEDRRKSGEPTGGKRKKVRRQENNKIKE